MKPFLGFDITRDEKNEQCNGDELIVARPSGSNVKALEKAGDESAEYFDSVLKPELFVRILLWVTGVLILFTMLFLSVADKLLSGEGLYSRFSWLIWLGVISAVIFFGLLVRYALRVTLAFKSDESKRMDFRFDSIVNDIYSELGVPCDAIDVDVFSFNYIVKNGVPVIKKTSDDISDVSNEEYKIYISDGQLCFAGAEAKYAFPIHSLTRIRAVNEKISMFGWNKDEAYNKGVYKQYKIKENNDIALVVKKYYVLEADVNGEKWGIYFPPYELPVIERLTELKSE